MLYTLPHYYHRFHCIAGECPDTCCAGWAIMIDSQSLKRYKKRRDEFGNRLFNSIDWKAGSFLQYEGRCAFLNDSQLCDIYSEAGPGYLCKTCKSYPRHTEEYEGLREISLSLSCVEAARLILGLKEPVEFLTKEREGEETYEAFDFFLFEKLMAAREFMFAVLRDRTLPVSLRLTVSLGLAHDIQFRINRGRLYEVDEVLKRYSGRGSIRKIEKKCSGLLGSRRESYEVMVHLFGLFQKLEVLKADWPQYIGNLRAILFSGGEQEYIRLRTGFLVYLKEDKERQEAWNQWGEQLFVYFIFTYFCGAVYDGHAYEKAKLAAAGVLILQDMARARWKERGNVLDFEDMVELACCFSKEVEHSDENLGILGQEFHKNPAFGFKKMLGALNSDFSVY